jgi:hypothetical protein
MGWGTRVAIGRRQVGPGLSQEQADARMSVAVALREEGPGLEEEGSQRMLEGGDRTVGMGKGGLEMREDLCRRPVRAVGGQFGWRAAPGQCRAELGLTQVETLPDALQRAVAEMAIGGTDGSANGAGGGELEESPKRTGGQAESADFVGTPDAESAPATRPCLAIAAKDASGADGFLFAVFVVKSIQRAVAIEGADNLAMRTGRLLEQLRKRRPFVQAAAKPSLLAHGPMPPQKS